MIKLIAIAKCICCRCFDICWTFDALSFIYYILTICTFVFLIFKLKIKLVWTYCLLVLIIVNSLARRWITCIFIHNVIWRAFYTRIWRRRPFIILLIANTISLIKNGTRRTNKTILIISYLSWRALLIWLPYIYYEKNKHLIYWK